MSSVTTICLNWFFAVYRKFDVQKFFVVIVIMVSGQTYYIQQLHSKFLTDLSDGSKLYDSSLTALPTVLFLASSFFLLYEHFHKYTRRRTRLKIFVYRELGFQSSYFYLTRIWFILMRIFKWISVYLERSVEDMSPEVELYLNKLFTKFCVFCTLMIFSLVPLLILVAQYFFKDDIPNFLLWVGENRWMRTEMGTAGQLLENPPRFSVPSIKKSVNLSRRTESAAANIWENRSTTSNTRACKSMIILNAPNGNIIPTTSNAPL